MLDQIRARSGNNEDLFVKLCEIHRRFVSQFNTMNSENSGKENKKTRKKLLKALNEEKAELEKEARKNLGIPEIGSEKQGQNSKVTKARSKNKNKKSKAGDATVLPDKTKNNSDEKKKIPNVEVKAESEFEVVSTYSKAQQAEQKPAFYNKGSQPVSRKRGTEVPHMVESKKAKSVEHSAVLGVPNAIVKGIPDLPSQSIKKEVSN